MQESARSRRVDQESCGELKRVVVLTSVEANAITFDGHLFERHLVEVHGSVALRLSDEKVIDIGPVPMRVSDVVVRTRGHEQLPIVCVGILERAIEFVMEEAEAALEAAADVGIRASPRAPFRERAQPREIVGVGQLLDQEIGERCGGFSNRKPRMASTLDEQDGSSAPAQRHRRQRTGEAAADDHHIGVASRPRDGHARTSSQLAQTTGGRTDCSRFMRASRWRRSERQS